MQSVINTYATKQLNHSLILKEIRRHGPLTKVDLADKFGLTFPAVSNIITGLIEAGLIKEAGYGQSSGGRPPLLYNMNWDSIYVIAVVIGVKEISASLIDLKAEVTDEIVDETKQFSLIKEVCKLIDLLLEHTNVDKTKILGIGVSAPGPINATDGRIMTPPNLKNVSNINITNILKNRYELPTVLEKDANAFALAQQWFGHVKPNEDILYIFNDQGLGSGLIINSRIHRGLGNGAGEIGHMTIDIDGPKCNCGNHGCLETFSSGIAIQRRVKEEIRRGFSTSLTDDYLNTGKNPAIEDIVQQAKNGDELSLHILNEAGRYLGLGIANAINLFTPNQIIFGGSVSKLYPAIIRVAERVAKQHAFSPFAKQIIFTESLFNHESTSIGAAAIIQQRLFDYPESNII